MKAKGVCCKCGREVPPDNDTLLLELEAKKIHEYGFDYQEEQVEKWISFALQHSPSQHLLPVVDGGSVVCAGSPDRAQYVSTDQPRLSNYNPENEAVCRAAYERMLARASARNKNAPRA